MSKPKVVSTVEARMGSSRLPGKTMMEILGKPTLELLLERLSKATMIDEIVVATSTNSEDDAIEEHCKKLGYKVFRGSSDNVLQRVSQAADSVNADIIVQITGDCILTSWEVVDEAVEYFFNHDIDYLSNLMDQTYPQGVDVRVFKADQLREISEIALKENDIPCQEHVYLYHEEHPDKYKIYQMVSPSGVSRPEWRLDLDYAEDLELLKIIFGDLYPSNPSFNLEELVKWLDNNQQHISVNQDMLRKPLRP